MASRSLPALIALLAATAVVGCGSLYHHREDLIVQREAKHEFDNYFAEQAKGKYARHFERGWRQGYYDVATGGRACPPSLPPQPYWSAKYKTKYGPHYVQQWYAGYTAGAEYAHGCGMQPTLPWQATGCQEPKVDACTPGACLGPCPTSPATSRGFEAYPSAPASTFGREPAEELQTPEVEPVVFQFSGEKKRLPPVRLDESARLEIDSAIER